MSFKSFAKSLVDYFLSIYFWRNLLYIIIFLAVIFVGANLYLKVYTRHNQKILTPELRGLTLEQAEKVIKSKGLRLKVIDSIYEGIGNPGTIVDQTPPSNFDVKKGRTIFVTIKAFSPKMISIPDFTQVSLTQAIYDIERLGLKVGNIEYVPSANFDNLVLAALYKDDTLKPGMKIPQGTAIDLVVAKKAADTLYQATPIDSNVQNTDVDFQDF